MKRQKIDIDFIRSRDNLLDAVHRAAKGKRARPDVHAFLADLDVNIEQSSNRVASAQLPCRPYRSFQIWDPKPRIIHAPSFSDRVIHHAIMNHIGERLNKTLVDSSFACRTGKGGVAAVAAVQKNLRCYSWYTKIDIDGYFNHIDHAILKTLLRHRFKGNRGIKLLDKIIDGFSHSSNPDSFGADSLCGLPIGALTSQYFANYYLDGADRYLKEQLGACAHVRYMDDIIWWSDSKAAAQQQLESLKKWLAKERHLTVKANVHLQRSHHGVRYCGYRISTQRLLLTKRRKQSYRKRLRYWESAYLRGDINARELQQAYAGVLGIVCQANSRSWRQKQINNRAEISA